MKVSLWLINAFGFILIQICASLPYDSIRVTNNPLPRVDRRSIVGYDALNKTILIVGGLLNAYQLTTFKDDIFVARNASYLTVMSHTQGQAYTQIDNILWFVASWECFHKYKHRNQRRNISINYYTNHYRCRTVGLFSIIR